MKDLGLYSSEIEAMIDFWNDLNINPDYSCNTDGYYNGFIFEFKLNNYNSIDVMKQLIRYVNARNTVAKELPRYGIGICVNKGTYQLYDLLKDQEKELNNGVWINTNDLLSKININLKITQKGWINQSSIISYNDLYYTLTDKISKDDFINELSNPLILNIQPYKWNETGCIERTLLDCLGSTGLKKRLGAFFTPDYAVKKSTDYLRNIIKTLKDDNYVIIDRCAGTGNLEKYLTKDELTHCILNTINYAEWLTLKGLYGDRALVLPLTNDKLNINDGLLLDGDALTKSFYESLIPLIKDKTIIVLENPPYSEPAAEAIRKGRTIKGSSNNYITDLMKCNNINGITARETANKFIWSAFELIKADYCIIYSPVKYFKSQSLINKQFIEGCIVNKKDFHATVGGISIMSWKNEDELVNEWKLENTVIKRVISKCSNNMPNKTSDGYVYISTKPLTPDYKNGHLENLYDNTCSTYNTVRLCNSLTIKQAIPLFVANCYKCKNYLEKEVIMKSSDKGLLYLNDKEFINDCLIWAGLSDKNKCISNCNITNQCCIGQITELDSIIDPVAYNTKAKKLKELWDNILTFIKSTSEYNASYKYGLYQINKDINVKVIVKTINGTYAINKTGNNIIEHKYSILNELIKKLKKELQNYYDKYISNKLFEYELLK